MKDHPCVSLSPGKREYLFKNDTGDAQVTVYELFPGVEVAYVSVHMGEFDFTETEVSFRDRYVGFHYCKEGRIEQEVAGEFFYLMPGDCSVVIQDRQVKRFSLPHNPDNSEGKILNLGSVKTADLEQIVLCEPDIIFIGGRLSASYDALSENAPVVYLAVDYEKGVVQSTYDNAKTIASVFGLEAEIDVRLC